MDRNKIAPVSCQNKTPYSRNEQICRKNPKYSMWSLKRVRAADVSNIRKSELYLLRSTVVVVLEVMSLRPVC